MKLDWTGEEVAVFKARLEAFEDAEATGPEEYVADLYDCETPMSLELSLAGGAVNVLAAEYLSFDEALDGWYLSGPVGGAGEIERALKSI